jgi:hypothetical protein
MSRSSTPLFLAWALALPLVAACGGTSSGTAPATAPTPAAETLALTPPPPTPPAATAAPSPSPTQAAAAMAITIEPDTCTYDGPTSIPYGPFEVTWAIRDTQQLEYGLFVFTLAPGKTLDDMKAAAATSAEDEAPPDWVTMLTIYPYGSPGTTEIFRRDLREMAAYKDGPIYIMCAHPDKVLGIFGPIEVEQ